MKFRAEARGVGCNPGGSGPRPENPTVGAPHRLHRRADSRSAEQRRLSSKKPGPDPLPTLDGRKDIGGGRGNTSPRPKRARFVPWTSEPRPLQQGRSPGSQGCPCNNASRDGNLHGCGLMGVARGIGPVQQHNSMCASFGCGCSMRSAPRGIHYAAQAHCPQCTVRCTGHAQ